MKLDMSTVSKLSSNFSKPYKGQPINTDWNSTSKGFH